MVLIRHRHTPLLMIAATAVNMLLGYFHLLQPIYLNSSGAATRSRANSDKRQGGIDDPLISGKAPAETKETVHIESNVLIPATYCMQLGLPTRRNRANLFISCSGSTAMPCEMTALCSCTMYCILPYHVLNKEDTGRKKKREKKNKTW